MKIAEIYRSVQGEGRLTGTESVFVRTSGCNLRCWFCDTRYASWTPEGNDLSVDQVLARVAVWDCPHVVLTGGEPMLLAELIPLTGQLQHMRRHITIETAGTLYLPVTCDLMSISPKLASSTPPADRHPRWHRRHERTRHVPDVVRRLTAEYDYQIKFVIDSPSDCRAVEHYLDQMPHLDQGRVLLMPQGTSVEQLARQAAWLEPYCREHGFPFCPRKQFEWFGRARQA